MGDLVKVKSKGITGVIVYETRNTFTVKSGGKLKVIPKKGESFIKDGLSYNGDALVGRVYERLDP